MTQTVTAPATSSASSITLPGDQVGYTHLSYGLRFWRSTDRRSVAVQRIRFPDAVEWISDMACASCGDTVRVCKHCETKGCACDTFEADGDGFECMVCG